MSSKLRLFSSRDRDLNTKIELRNEVIEIATEDLGARKAKIVSRVYKKGEIVSSVNYDYSHLAGSPDMAASVKSIMEQQHKAVQKSFEEECNNQKRTKAHYASELRKALQKDLKTALPITAEALQIFPGDPYFLSYSGYLTAVVQGKWREGTKICNEAIRILKKSRSDDMNFFLPLFYLFLGKAFLKGDRRKDALHAFQTGLKFDSRHNELLAELKALGIRQQPVIPFLDRKNPVNRYLGKLRYKRQDK